MEYKTKEDHPIFPNLVMESSEYSPNAVSFEMMKSVCGFIMPIALNLWTF